MRCESPGKSDLNIHPACLNCSGSTDYRTGTTRRSNESIEMQPLQGNTSGGSGSGSKTPKTALRRMARVKSDDIHTEDEGKDNEKVPSPIGAGLPLLQRLRLLKEKQVSYLRMNRIAQLTNRSHIILINPLPLPTKHNPCTLLLSTPFV